ncbi:MAG TPA: cellulase family glycosylhydrolase [Polyangiaceae bacterium]|nr:cellulase family glycosylhydrolase [Polyangiaceae bacterium]
MRWAAPTLVIAMALACDGSGTAVRTWSVKNGFVRDAQGRAVVLRGANVSGKQKQAPWFDFHGPADFARMRSEWGMNAVRFVMQWAAIEPTKGVYDDAYLDAVAERVGWMRDAGVQVVLDMHQDVYGMGFASGGGDGAPLWTCDASHYAGFKPTNPWAIEDLEPGVVACYDGFWNGAELQAHFAEAWRRVAARLAGYENVVGFDPYNEPFWGSHPIEHFEPDLLAPFYEMIVPAVRSEAPGWIAFIEPSSSRNLGGTTYLPVPTFGNFAYAPHSYDTNAESGTGFDPSHRALILSNVAKLAGEAHELGGALWIGEYGGTASDPTIEAYMTAQYDAAGAVAASSMYWDYTKGGYGFLNADGTDAEPLLQTLVRPYPQLVAGDPVSWAFDASTSVFTFTYRPDTSNAAPTVLSVPSRVYPSGYAVACGGCTWSTAPGSLTITAPGGSNPVVVTLKPTQ